MSYIAQIPSNVVIFDGNSLVIDISQTNRMNEFYTNINEITGKIRATNEGGSSSIAEAGETLTIPTASGDTTGSYVDPVTFTTPDVTFVDFHLLLKTNPIGGHVMRAEDSTVYIVTDQPMEKADLGACIR